MTLLKRFLPSREHEAILGDIVEESRHRSRLWYWSQLLAVLVVASWTDVRTNKWLAARATAMGILTLAVVFYPASVLLYVVRVLSEGGYYIGLYWLTLPHSALVALPFVVTPLGFGVSGWVIARLHRAHGIALVLPYTLLVSVITVVVIVRLALDNGSGTRHDPLTALFFSAITAMLSLPGCVVLGAVLGLKRDLRGVSKHD